MFPDSEKMSNLARLKRWALYHYPRFRKYNKSTFKYQLEIRTEEIQKLRFLRLLGRKIYLLHLSRCISAAPAPIRLSIVDLQSDARVSSTSPSPAPVGTGNLSFLGISVSPESRSAKNCGPFNAYGRSTPAHAKRCTESVREKDGWTSNMPIGTGLQNLNSPTTS